MDRKGSIITGDTILRGIDEGLVKFEIDPNLGHGTVCRIGEYWFYFGGLAAEDENPEEFLKNSDIAELAADIAEAIIDMFRFENSVDEGRYYENYLFENLKPTYSVVFIECKIDNAASDYIRDSNDEVYVYKHKEYALAGAEIERNRKRTPWNYDYRIIKSVGTCKRCGQPLFPSDIEGYRTQCFSCDEVFYRIEQEEEIPSTASQEFKYVLVSVCEREILTEVFDTKDKAQLQMMTEFADAAGVDLQDCSNPTWDDGECGYGEDCAYVNDGPNHQNYDWRIVCI